MSSKDKRSGELTKAEEEVMQLLWNKGKAFVKELRSSMNPPRPAYNTVLTVVRILERKGFVGHEAVGRSHRYYPLISKKDYSRRTLEGLKERFFGGSYENLLSFLVSDDKLTRKEIEEIERMIEAKEKGHKK